MWCPTCGGTGLAAPSRNGLTWGDLLLDRATGELVRVKYIACRRFVVEGLAEISSRTLKVHDMNHWRGTYLRCRVKFPTPISVPDDPDTVDLFV